MQCRNIECEDDQGGGKEEVGDNPVNGIVGRSGCEVRLGKVNLLLEKESNIICKNARNKCEKLRKWRENVQN